MDTPLDQTTGPQLPPPVMASPPAADSATAGQEAVPAAEHLRQTGLAPLSLPLPPTPPTSSTPSSTTVPVPAAVPAGSTTPPTAAANPPSRTGNFTGPPATTPPLAAAPPDDQDLIEKEWVNKAKAIVDHTRNDPHKQAEELTLFRADYMKKRYDKHIKLSK